MKQKSLRQLAKEIGVSASYLSQVRNGKCAASQRIPREVLSRLLSNNPDAEGGTRTHTPFRETDFKSAASTTSATSALLDCKSRTRQSQRLSTPAFAQRARPGCAELAGIPLLQCSCKSGGASGNHYRSR